MIDISHLEREIDEIDTRSRSWKWAPDDPFPQFQQEVFSAFQDIGDSYLEATPDQRRVIRELLAKHKSLHDQLFNCLHNAAHMVQVTGDPKWLRLGLVAATLENLQEDARDTYGHLGYLFLAAIQAGIDPISYFKQVAAISSTEVKNISHESMQGLLANFHQSPYFEQEIKPKLNE